MTDQTLFLTVHLKPTSAGGYVIDILDQDKIRLSEKQLQGYRVDKMCYIAPNDVRQDGTLVVTLFKHEELICVDTIKESDTNQLLRDIRDDLRGLNSKRQ